MKVGGRFRRWTQREAETAARVYADVIAKAPPDAHRSKTARTKACEAVAKAIGRPATAVSTRLTGYGPTFFDYDHSARAAISALYHKVEPSTFIKPTDNEIRERDYRATLTHQSITAAFCGDPLPGYSALDRKRQIVEFPR